MLLINRSRPKNLATCALGDSLVHQQWILIHYILVMYFTLSFPFKFTLSSWQIIFFNNFQDLLVVCKFLVVDKVKTNAITSSDNDSCWYGTEVVIKHRTFLSSADYEEPKWKYKYLVRTRQIIRYRATASKNNLEWFYCQFNFEMVNPSKQVFFVFHELMQLWKNYINQRSNKTTHSRANKSIIIIAFRL